VVMTSTETEITVWEWGFCGVPTYGFPRSC
jgi:hypothetical protein